MKEKYLKWELDTETPIDPQEPLGTIVILGEKGILEEKDIYLDSFFEAMINAIDSLKINGFAKVDILESYDFLIYKKENSLQIEFESQRVLLKNFQEFSREILEAINDFLQLIDKISEDMGQEKEKLATLRKYTKH